MPNEEQWLNLVRTSQILLTDKLPVGQPADVVFLPSLSEGMIESGRLFEAVAKLYWTGQFAGVAFNGSAGEDFSTRTPGRGWVGAKRYEEELRVCEQFGFPVPPLFPTRPAFHTRDETDALVELAKQNQWSRVIIVTVAYHFPRVFICLVQSMKTIGYGFAAYAAAAPTDWLVPMKGSQGKEDTDSFTECLKDSRKVFEYQKKGFGCSFDELFDYLKRR